MMKFGVSSPRPGTPRFAPVGQGLSAAGHRLAAIFGACLLAGGLFASHATAASLQDYPSSPGAAPQAAIPQVAAAEQAASEPATPVPAGQEAAYRFVIAKMLAAEGDLVAADAAFREALDLLPGEPYLHLEYASHLIRLAGANRGDRRLALLEQARAQAEAARDLAEAAGEGSSETAIWRTLAEVYQDLSQGDPSLQDDARRALERVIAKDPDDLESSLSLGQIYLNDRQPARAAEIFSRVAERTAANRFVFSLLAESLMRSGRLAEAEGVLHRLLALDPSARQVRLGLAGLESERGDHEAALRTLQEAPEGLRRQPDVRRRIALELLMSDRPDEAREILEPLYEEEPDSPPLIGAMVLTLAAQGDDEALDGLVASIEAGEGRRRELAALLDQNGQDLVAERVLRDTLAELEGRRGDTAARNAAAVRFQLADLLSQRGEMTAAAELVEPLTRRGDREERREVTLAYVSLLSDAGRTGEALARLDALRTGADQRAVTDALRVEILLAAGRDREARAILDEMAASGDPEVVARAARAAQAEQRYDLSIPLLERLIDEGADDASPDHLFLLAAAYERTGRPEESARLFERLIADVPTHHPALNYLGYMWAERGENLDRALELIRRAVAAQPEQGSYLDSLGWVHYQLGDHELALAYLQRAAKLLGEEPEIQKHLGDVLSALGETDEARRAYQRAVELTESGDTEELAELNRKLERLSDASGADRLELHR